MPVRNYRITTALIGMAYTPCYKLLKIMNEEQIYKLEINQLVKVKCKEPIDGFFIAKVKSINDWTIICQKRTKLLTTALSAALR